jgi:hypothetical protein
MPVARMTVRARSSTRPHAGAESVRFDVKVIDDTRPKRHIISQGLLAQPIQQLDATNTPEAGIVVACRNEPGAALSAIDHTDRAAVARKINSGGEAGGAPADNKAVKHLRSHGPSQQQARAPVPAAALCCCNQITRHAAYIRNAFCGTVQR